MDASTSQDVADLVVSAKCPKTSSDFKSPTVSEQLLLLTTRVDQLRLTSEKALEHTKPLIQTYQSANIKQFQYLDEVQQQVAQFFVDLNIEKNERLKLCTTLRQLEDELAQYRRLANERSPSSLPIPFTVDPPPSTALEVNCAVNNAELSKPPIKITLKRASSTTSKTRLTDQPRGSTPPLPTSRPSSLNLEPRVNYLEEEITKARNCHETNISFYRSQFTFLYDRFQALETRGTNTILWKLTSLRLVFDTA